MIVDIAVEIKDKAGRPARATVDIYPDEISLVARDDFLVITPAFVAEPSNLESFLDFLESAEFIPSICGEIISVDGRDTHPLVGDLVQVSPDNYHGDAIDWWWMDKFEYMTFKDANPYSTLLITEFNVKDFLAEEIAAKHGYNIPEGLRDRVNKISGKQFIWDDVAVRTRFRLGSSPFHDVNEDFLLLTSTPA